MRATQARSTPDEPMGSEAEGGSLLIPSSPRGLLSAAASPEREALALRTERRRVAGFCFSTPGDFLDHIRFIE
jgi:hypothetical protein